MTDPTPVKDCISCPSYLEASSAPGVFNRSIGSPMCGTFGYALGKPGATPAQDTKLRKQKAENCAKFGEARAPEPRRDTYVMLPMPELRDPANIQEDLKTNCPTCAACKNFVPEFTVRQDLGWTAGLCAAKGKLLMTNRLSHEAQNCDYRQFGAQLGTTSGMLFLPEYSDAFLGGAANPVAAFRAAQSAGFVEPGDWPTDKEITEEDRTAGIKSWRKVIDPSGAERCVYYPVFDSGFFDDEDRDLIPKTGSDEHPELYIDHFGGLYALGVAWFELDETPSLWGSPGTGKTELLRYVSWIMQTPFRRVSITASSEVDDIIGKMLYTPEKGTYFQYGVLPEAWQKPGVLCIDEPNVAKDPGVWHVMRPLTDNSKQLVIDQNDHERVERNVDCYMGMCMNPAWDVRNVGTMEIADADANRLFHIFLNMPPEELEREIIKERVKVDGWEISPENLNALMATAKDIRGLADDMALPISWAIRPQIKVARAIRWFSPIEAYRRAVADFLEPEAQEVLFDQVRAHWTEA